MNFENEFRKTREDALAFQAALDILKAMLDGLDERDEDAMFLWHTFCDKCVRYASIRSKWYNMEREERLDTDDLRTSAHDSVITNLNMLSRYQERNGKDISWRSKLDSRKCIGDFACYVALHLALESR